MFSSLLSKSILVLCISKALCTEFKLPSHRPVTSCTQLGNLAMIFSGGPGMETGTILDALEDNGQTPATFFVVTDYLDQPIVESSLRTILDHPKHNLGLYAKGIKISEVDEGELVKKVNRMAAKMKAHTGVSPLYIKFDGGQKIPIDKLNALKSSGFVIVDIGIDSNDYNNPDRGLSQYQAVLGSFKKVIKGSFIVGHNDVVSYDSGELKAIIEYVKSMKYKFVNMDECIGRSPGLSSTGKSSSSTVKSSKVRSMSEKKKITDDDSAASGIMSYTSVILAAVTGLAISVVV